MSGYFCENEHSDRNYTTYRQRDKKAEAALDLPRFSVPAFAMSLGCTPICVAQLSVGTRPVIQCRIFWVDISFGTHKIAESRKTYLFKLFSLGLKKGCWFLGA